MQVAYFGIFIVVITVMAVEKLLSPRGMNFNLLLTGTLQRWYFPYWGGILVLAFAAIFILFAGWLFERMEWPELEEG